jgi:CcmD family protein
MTTAEKYVTAAYVVVFVLVLAYVLLIAVKLGRIGREVEELERRVEQPEETGEREPTAVG